MSINEWHTNTGICNCNNCFEFRNKKMDTIQTETTMGTMVDDGEDGSFIDYSFFKDLNKLDEQSKKIRQFASGATRDTSEGKLEYARFNSPIVMKRYAEYMDTHRKQSDGNLREPDNWMNLFGDKHEDVCLDSLMRHLMDVWLINKGFHGEAREDIEGALCAILFNTNAYLFKVLLDKQKGKETNEPK